MSWLHPEYFWALALVPAAVALFLWASWQRRQGLERFGDRPLVRRLTEAVSPRRRRWKAAFVVLALFLLGVSLVGPRFGTRLREVKREGVDLMIALDVSLSMQAEDVAPSRLARAKFEIKKLLDELRGDRVGLVIFAGDAFVQCPLTTDYGAVRLFLDVASAELVPTPGTDFGAALRRSIQAFEGAEEEDDGDEARTRALLVVSDGENHVEGLDGIIEQARDAGIVLFAAGVGETEGAPIPVYQRGRRTGYKQDREGRAVSSRLEEDVLQRLAADGGYFRIARTSSSLLKITDRLSRLERSEFGAEVFEEYDERYQWPLALGLLLLLAERLVSTRRRSPAPSPTTT